MINCPSCHQQIEIGSQFHGTLFNCPKCSAVYFVGWDGKPEEAIEHEPFVAEDASENEAPAAQEPQSDFQAAEEEIPAAEPVLDMPISDSFAEPAAFDHSADSGFALMGDGNMFAAPKENFSDIEKFGNSNEPQQMTYTLRIAGVDLQETSDLVLEAMTDSRFGWDAKEVFSSLQNGELVISRMGPVKAAVLISRLSSLPIQLEWSQHVLSEV